MSGGLHKLSQFGDKIMNGIEDTVSGGAGTSKTLFSKVADPFRQLRQHDAAGGGAAPNDLLDPNGQLHKIDTPADIKEKKYLEDTAPQRAADEAANAATQASNAAMIARRRRRQSGLGSLATGATSGTPQLSTATATGKSTLGA